MDETRSGEAGGAPARRVVAMVRTHRPKSAKALELGRLLREAGFREVVFVTDETNGPVDAAEFEKLPHTLDSLAALGLRMHGGRVRTLWFCGDYAFYGSVLGRGAPGDFHLMVEYDVGLREMETDWFDRLRVALEAPDWADLDMIGPYLGPYGKAHFRHAYAKPWKSLFAVTGLSGRAVETLYAARRREMEVPPPDPRGTHCEIFVPSELQQAGGFRLADINELVPGIAARPGFSVGAVCPIGHEDLLGGQSGLVHRVLDMDDYLLRAPGVMARNRQLDLLRRHLEVLQRRGLDPAQAAETMARAERELARMEKRAQGRR